MNKYFNLTYLILTFILVIICWYILPAIFLPDQGKIKIQSTNIVNTPTIESYLNNTYNFGKNDPNDFISDIVNYTFLDYNKNLKNQVQNISSAFKYFNCFYETAPNELINAFKTAKNTAKTWPPKYDEKYRLLSFPYVSGNIFTGLYQILAAKPNESTVPCWFISKYDSNNYNNSLYNKVFNREIKTHLLKPSYELLTTFFGNVVEYETTGNSNSEDSNPEHLLTYKTGGYVLEKDFLDPKTDHDYYLEVQHTCFPLPGYDYPMCDDGSWWTYLSVGSGIWWNAKKPIIAKNKLHLLYCCGWTIEDFVDITKNFGGGDKLMDSIFTIIYNQQHPNPKDQKQLKGLGFRRMQGDNGDVCVSKFFVNLILFLVIILYLLILICKNIYEIFKNFKNKSSVILKTLYISIFMIIIFTLAWYFLYVSLEDFFTGLGWLTLDMAYKETNMSPYQFFEEAIFGTNSNPICNGLNITEWFDEFLYLSVSAKGFKSAIMTMQPNKSGCWMVEMFDLTNWTNDPNMMTPELGICGNQQLGSGGNYNNYKKILDCSDDEICSLDNTPINGIIPMSKNCKGKSTISLNEHVIDYNCNSVSEGLNENKLCDVNGCNDTNNAICMSCIGVPTSLVCLSNKKINYSA